MTVTCPECSDKFDTRRGFATHWGYKHDGPTPDDIDTSRKDTVKKKISSKMSGENAPWYSVTGSQHPRHGKEGAYKGVTGKDHPTFGKTVNVCSEVVEETGHKVRGSWEKEIDLMLHKSSFTYEYEPKAFKIKNKTYTPDFKVNDNIIEVKGRVFDTCELRAKNFISMYPEYTYIVIGSELPCDIHIEWNKRDTLIDILNKR